MSLNPGSRIGAFDIISKLGEGGMGEVYLAQDTKLNRRVAVKVLLQSGAADPEHLARLEREARVFAALNHPNIGSIYGVEEAEGFLALVLEFVEGPTLADLIGRGMTLADALPLAHQIAEALESAHAQGIIHRDLKPANIKVRPDGTVKVLDFGLAKLTDPGGATNGGGNVNLTASPTLSIQGSMAGMILGTAAYMSPEQARGRPVDRRTDVWAFGCVLFEMLTGSRAFEGDDVAETIGAVIHREPDWTRLAPTTPATVLLVLRRCLEKDSKRRIRDIGDVQLALGGAFDAPAPMTAADGAKKAPSWRRALSIAAAALLLAGAAAGIAWRIRPTADAAPIIRYAIQLPQNDSFSGLNRTMVAISPDGSQLAYLANDRLFVRALSEFEPRMIAGDPVRQDRAGDALGLSGFGARSSPVFSPDGRSIAFYSQVDQSLRRIALNGGAAVPLCRTGITQLPAGLRWDGDDILFGGLGNGIFRCDVNRGVVEQLVRLKEGELAFGPQWLPGKQALLFTMTTGLANGDTRWEGAEIVAYDVKSGTRRTVAHGAAGMYVPTGHLLYAQEGVVLAAPFDAVRQMVTRPAVAVIEGVRRTTNTANSGIAGVQMAVSANGNLVFLPGAASTSVGDVAVGVADRTGVATRLPVLPGSYEQIRASPDGTHIAVGSYDGTEGIVSTYGLDGLGELRRLTFSGRNRFPIWSPDGQRIAFQSDRDGDLAIFAQRADGNGPAERLTKPVSGEAHVPESWSGAGVLAFSVRKDAQFSLYMLSLVDGKTLPFGNVRSAEPINSTFSRDGRWIAYTSSPASGPVRSSNRGVFVQPFPATGSQYQVPHAPNELVFEPVWGPKGAEELVYVPSATSGRLAVVPLTTTGSSVAFGARVAIPAIVTGLRGSGATRAFDMLPDGRFIGILQPSEAVESTPQIRVVLNWFEELKARVPGK